MQVHRPRRHDMRMMLMVKGDPDPGAAPSEELLTAMSTYNEELEEAGVLVDLAGLHPKGNRSVIDGTAGDSKEPVAGYWILQVESMVEALGWAKRFPFEALSRIYPGEYGAQGEIELRQVFEMEPALAEQPLGV
jgi:hypothetical protein